MVPLRVRPHSDRFTAAAIPARTRALLACAAVLRRGFAPGADPRGADRRSRRHRRPGDRLAGQSVQASRGRADARRRLHEGGRHALHRQPDRVGRPALPAGHDRNHQRGHPALRAGRTDPGQAPEDVPARAGPKKTCRPTNSSPTARRRLPTKSRSCKCSCPPPAGPERDNRLRAAPADAVLRHPGHRQLLAYWDTVADRLFRSATA